MDIGLEFIATIQKKNIDKKRVEIKITLIEPSSEVLLPYGL
jgi:hypothetical protein